MPTTKKQAKSTHAKKQGGKVGEVVKATEQVPAAFEMHEGARAPGTENIRQKDVNIPRIRLIQPTSYEATARGSEKIEAGSIIHGLTNEVLHKMDGEPVELIPLLMQVGRSEFDAANRLLYRSLDAVHHGGLPRPDGITLCAKCPDAMWTGVDGKTPPKCPENYMYPVLVRGKEYLGPAMLILRGKSFPAGKAMNTPIYWSNLPYYSFVFKIKCDIENGVRGNYYIYKVDKYERLDKTSESYAIAEAIFNKLYSIKEAGGVIETDMDDEPAVKKEGVHYEYEPGFQPEAAPEGDDPF
jgi:hypothetical protein